MCGCGTVGTVRKAFMSDKKVSAEQKQSYLHYLEDLEATQKAYKPYHYVALGFLVAGGIMLAYGAFVPTTAKAAATVGAVFMGTGVGISAWAKYAPAHDKMIGVIVSCLVIAGLSLIGLKIWNSRHRCTKDGA